jgi:hypothetical protein
MILIRSDPSVSGACAIAFDDLSNLISDGSDQLLVDFAQEQGDALVVPRYRGHFGAIRVAHRLVPLARNHPGAATSHQRVPFPILHMTLFEPSGAVIAAVGSIGTPRSQSCPE